MTELIRFDKNHSLQFEGRCKISINKLSSILIVEPENEEFKMITASFKWKFILKKNFLFVIADFNFLDFCLAFKNDEICQKVLRHLSQQNNEEPFEPSVIGTHFLHPIFEKIRDSPPNSILDLCQIISQWFSSLDENDEMKRNSIKLMKDLQVYDLIKSTIKNLETEKFEEISVIPPPQGAGRKRKFAKISKKKNKNSYTNQLSNKSKFTKCIFQPQFKLMRRPCTRHRKLLIFTFPELTTFHEFDCYSRNGIFQCAGPECQQSAIIDVDENGRICAKLNSSASHQCKPWCQSDKVIQKNYVEIKFVQKPNFILHENFNKDGTKTLIILDSNKLCYEYNWIPTISAFMCKKCSRKNLSRIKANLRNEGTEKEYVELINVNHICEKIPYDPEKFTPQYFNCVFKPDFQILNSFFNNEKGRKTLVIFDADNRNLCHSYFFDSYYHRFLCSECYKKRIKVSAKLHKNSDDVEYVILSITKHICELRNYNCFKEIIFQPPQIEFMEETKTGFPKLFIFDKTDPKKCYVFSQHDSKGNSLLYYCMQCRQISYRRKVKNDVTGRLFKNEVNQSYSFRLRGFKNHICEPIKYEPEQFQLIPKTYDFFFYRLQKGKAKSLHVAIYLPENGKLCFKLNNLKGTNTFICYKCMAKKRTYSIKMEKDENGKEYFRHDSKNHICIPVKVSSISGPNFLRCENSGLEEEEPKKKVIEKVDKNKIVKLPNFELRRSQLGTLNGKLFIFDSKNKDMCHEYILSKKHAYKCQKCHEKKHLVSAKLHTENHETFVVLGNQTHICEPLEYHPLKIVESPNFKIFNQNDEKVPMKIAVFTSDSQEFCYLYSCRKKSKVFLCLTCAKLSKDISAKLLTSENGEEYLELSKTDHICQPRKYEPEKLQSSKPKIIPESLYEFRPNTLGVADRHLMVFMDEKKDLCYNLRCAAKNYFTCEKCKYQKVFVTIFIRKNETGERYLETNGIEHVCQPEKPKPPKTIVKCPDFVVYYKPNEEYPSKLVIFTSSDHSRCYEYNFDKQYRVSFWCSGCSKIKKSSAAKLVKDENGEEHVEFNQHFCEPMKFDPSKFKMLKPASQ